MSVLNIEHYFPWLWKLWLPKPTEFYLFILKSNLIERMEVSHGNGATSFSHTLNLVPSISTPTIFSNFLLMANRIACKKSFYLFIYLFFWIRVPTQPAFGLHFFKGSVGLQQINSLCTHFTWDMKQASAR